MIWAKTRDYTVDVRISILQQYKLVKELCEQSLNTILNDGVIKRFKPGQLVLQCHPRSPLNKKAREQFYDLEYGHHMQEEIYSNVEQ